MSTITDTMEPGLGVDYARVETEALAMPPLARVHLAQVLALSVDSGSKSEREARWVEFEDRVAHAHEEGRLVYDETDTVMARLYSKLKPGA